MNKSCQLHPAKSLCLPTLSPREIRKEFANCLTPMARDGSGGYEFCNIVQSPLTPDRHVAFARRYLLLLLFLGDASFRKEFILQNKVTKFGTKNLPNFHLKFVSTLCIPLLSPTFTRSNSIIFHPL